VLRAATSARVPLLERLRVETVDLVTSVHSMWRRPADTIRHGWRFRRPGGNCVDAGVTGGADSERRTGTAGYCRNVGTRRTPYCRRYSAGMGGL